MSIVDTSKQRNPRRNTWPRSVDIAGSIFLDGVLETSRVSGRIRSSGVLERKVGGGRGICILGFTRRRNHNGPHTCVPSLWRMHGAVPFSSSFLLPLPSLPFLFAIQQPVPLTAEKTLKTRMKWTNRLAAAVENKKISSFFLSPFLYDGWNKKSHNKNLGNRVHTIGFFILKI